MPNEITYNTIIHGYCWEGNIEKAFQFHNKMVENSFKPDVYTCNILLRGLCREGMLEKAIKLFNTWIDKGKTIDVVTYNTLITALCKDQRLEDALGLVAEMEEKNVQRDKYTHNAIIGALTDAGRLKEAEEFLSNMTERERPSEQRPQMDNREHELTAESSHELDPSSTAYSQQIDELCAEGRYKDAMLIYTELTQRGIALQKSTYFTLIKGLIKRRKSVSKTG